MNVKRIWHSKYFFIKRRIEMFEELKSVLVEKLDLNEADIEETTSFKDDLGVDSLDLFDLVMELEDKFGFDIPAEDLESIATVGDMVKYLESKKAE